VAAWTLTAGASYSLVSHIVHIRAVTDVPTARPEVGVLVDATTSQITGLAPALSSEGLHVTFALAQPSAGAARGIFAHGDQAIPLLRGGGLVRWLGTGDQLRDLCAPLGLHHHFVYASTGPSVGQSWLAYSAGGRLVAGALLLDDPDDIARLHSGEVVEIRPSRGASVSTLLDELRGELRADDLTGVPVGRLMHDGGVAV